MEVSRNQKMQNCKPNPIFSVRAHENLAEYEFACEIPCSWGDTFTTAVRGYPPTRFPSHVLFIKSYREMPAGDAAETTTQQLHDGVAHGSRAIHRGQGASVNPFGYPPSL